MHVYIKVFALELILEFLCSMGLEKCGFSNGPN